MAEYSPGPGVFDFSLRVISSGSLCFIVIFLSLRLLIESYVPGAGIFDFCLI